MEITVTGKGHADQWEKKGGRKKHEDEHASLYPTLAYTQPFSTLSLA
jgi:hypothetical protein